MLVELEREAQLLSDFRNMAVKDQDFLMSYAKSAASANVMRIPEPKVLDESQLGLGELVRKLCGPKDLLPPKL